MTTFNSDGGAPVVSTSTKEVGGNPHVAAPPSGLAGALEAELVSTVFLREQASAGPLYEPPPVKPPKKRRERTPERIEMERKARAAQRAKWIAMGIIKPRAQWLAEVKKRA